MLKLKSFTEDHDRSMVPPKRIPTSVRRTNSHFHCAPEFYTQTLAHMLDSLVRVSRRVGYNHFVHITILQIPKVAKRSIAPQYNPSQSLNAFTSEEATFQTMRLRQIILMWTCSTYKHKPKGKWKIWINTLVAICSLLAISGTLSLSFQSSLHLSLTVLVRYRSLANI